MSCTVPIGTCACQRYSQAHAYLKPLRYVERIMMTCVEKTCLGVCAL